MRKATLERETGETKISLNLDLDGSGRSNIRTGVGFFDHMLALFARHGLFDLEVSARGDLDVDAHHIVEDVAIVLGQALARALGEKRGVRRMGHAIVPMDEALALVALDLSGRGYSGLDLGAGAGPLGAQMDVDLVRHFLETFSREGGVNLHVRVLAGENGHHRMEAIFKGLGRALDDATQRDPRLGNEVPSTKGTL